MKRKAQSINSRSLYVDDGRSVGRSVSKRIELWALIKANGVRSSPARATKRGIRRRSNPDENKHRIASNFTVDG